jgi:hypothetical protein
MNELKVNLENLTADERKQLTALIEKSQKPEMIKCTGGYYCIDAYGRIDCCDENDDLQVNRGLKYQKIEEAEKENAALTELRIINNIIRQENKRTGFVADFSGEQFNYYVGFDEVSGCVILCSHRSINYSGFGYCSQESAYKIKDWLARGMIEGITRGKIK